jgi:hypothetical protein
VADPLEKASAGQKWFKVEKPTGCFAKRAVIPGIRIIEKGSHQSRRCLEADGERLTNRDDRFDSSYLLLLVDRERVTT